MLSQRPTGLDARRRLALERAAVQVLTALATHRAIELSGERCRLNDSLWAVDECRVEFLDALLAAVEVVRPQVELYERDAARPPGDRRYTSRRHLKTHIRNVR